MKAIHSVVLALTALGACSDDHQHASADCCAEDVGSSSFSDTSLYNLDSSWRDHEGREHRLSDIRGKVQVVAMIFTHCEYACPRILADLKAIESRLAPGAQVGFLLASFDTERDRPEALAAYAQEHDLSPDTWTLLHGEAGPVRELAAALGVRYSMTPGGGFAHSNVVTVLDADGEIVHRHEGLGADPTPIVTAIQEQLSAHR